MNRRPLLIATLAAAALAGIVGTAGILRADYPKPSIYPTSWELKFDHGKPRRVVVDLPGDPAPRAYWYLRYTVTNNTTQDQTFLPVFEMLSSDGAVTRADRNIAAGVFDYIKQSEKSQFLVPFAEVAGTLRVGDAQAKESVAIWPEPTPKMGEFSIFVGGLSGEFVEMKDDKGTVLKDAEGHPMILRKALQLDYKIRGDEIAPQRDELQEVGSSSVMR